MTEPGGSITGRSETPTYAHHLFARVEIGIAVEVNRGNSRQAHLSRCNESIMMDRPRFCRDASFDFGSCVTTHTSRRMRACTGAGGATNVCSTPASTQQGSHRLTHTPSSFVESGQKPNMSCSRTQGAGISHRDTGTAVNEDPTRRLTENQPAAEKRKPCHRRAARAPQCDDLG